MQSLTVRVPLVTDKVAIRSCSSLAFSWRRISCKLFFSKPQWNAVTIADQSGRWQCYKFMHRTYRKVLGAGVQQDTWHRVAMNYVNISFRRENWFSEAGFLQGNCAVRLSWFSKLGTFISSNKNKRNWHMGFLCPAKGTEYRAYKASAKHHQNFSFHLLDTIKTVKVFSFVPLGPNLCGEGPSWFPISFSEIWGWSAKRNLALVRKHLKSRGDPLCKNLMKARCLKCFSILRYNGKYIYETKDLHLSDFFLFSPQFH